MLNWPGWNPAPPSSASSSVNVSAVSRRRRRMRCRRGTSGACGRAAVSATSTIDVEQLKPRGLQPLLHHPRDTLQEFVAEIVVRFALAAETAPVECERARVL